MNHNQHLRGFSLIEIMIAVAILGLLASMAIPGYERYIINTKKTERTTLVKNLVNDMRGYFDRNEGSYILSLPLSPAAPITNSKKPFVPSSNEWKKLNFLDMNASVYYHYYAYGEQTNNQADFLVTATGDLDGNGVASAYTEQWRRTSDVWTLVYKTTNETEW